MCIFKNGRASLLLIVCLVMSCLLTPASALSEDQAWLENDFLGYSDVQTGDLIVTDEDVCGDSERQATTRVLFSMRANGVTELLTTYSSGKYFFLDDYEDGYFYMKGTLTNSLGEYQRNLDTKVGICYKDQWNNEFVAATADYFGTGATATSDRWYTTRLKEGVQYYAYINNYLRYGEVSGSLTLYFTPLDILINSVNDR